MLHRLRPLLLAIACASPLAGSTLVMAQSEGGPFPAPEGGGPGAPPPLTPPPPVSPDPVPAAELPRSRPSLPTPPPVTAESPDPLRPSLEQLPKDRPQRFDASLDALVRDGIVTPKERVRVRGSLVLDPVPGLRKQACGSGALSAEECRTGVVFRGRGRPDSEAIVVPGVSAPALAGPGGGGSYGQGMAREAISASPLPPISVPVNALLAGIGGRFRLTDVFRLTPRPSPIGGNGNRGLLFPLVGSAVPTSNFGWRLHPILGSWIMHSGRDFAAPEGTPVVAALSGRVVSSGDAGGYGLAIEIEHERPMRRTLYGHLSELYVKPGDSVRQGEVIGRVGSTGLSTGPHLHFELRLPQDGGWVATDPGEMLPAEMLTAMRLPGLPAGAATHSAGEPTPDAVALLIGQLLQTLERPAGSPAPGPRQPSPGSPQAG
ncbi:MAG: M23 family metallopeptidase [Cyanobacteriota bacterium]|jgi:murein DD-endopeptidase MepM/ murein hydrolase activator NlpD|nr:M23 family metallopeptidase [Cyanobacteriota bacterium]